MTGPPILFDLDGTLSDPLPGIVGSIAHALAALGQPVPASAELSRWIGPPLRVSFARALATDDSGLVERALALYRERYVPIGMYENALYPGIADLLAALHGAGRPLFVATSKPWPYAERVLEHFAIRRYFTAVSGPELDGRRDSKALVVAELLPRLGDRAGVVLVGDREQDVHAARVHGLGAIAVAYGYGTAAELAAAAPDAIAASVADLRVLLGA